MEMRAEIYVKMGNMLENGTKGLLERLRLCDSGCFVVSHFCGG